MYKQLFHASLSFLGDAWQRGQASQQAQRLFYRDIEQWGMRLPKAFINWDYVTGQGKK